MSLLVCLTPHRRLNTLGVHRSPDAAVRSPRTKTWRVICGTVGRDGALGCSVLRLRRTCANWRNAAGNLWRHGSLHDRWRVVRWRSSCPCGLVERLGHAETRRIRYSRRCASATVRNGCSEFAWRHLYGRLGTSLRLRAERVFEGQR